MRWFILAAALVISSPVAAALPQSKPIFQGSPQLTHCEPVMVITNFGDLIYFEQEWQCWHEFVEDIV